MNKGMELVKKKALYTKSSNGRNVILAYCDYFAIIIYFGFMLTVITYKDHVRLIFGISRKCPA
jgi:hypothetical protein